MTWSHRAGESYRFAYFGDLVLSDFGRLIVHVLEEHFCVCDQDLGRSLSGAAAAGRGA